MTMLTEYTSHARDNDGVILSSSFVHIENVNNLDPETIFPVGSVWTDRELLYSTIKTYSARIGWKPCIVQSSYIKCSCYKKIVPDEENTTKRYAGTISKGCRWSIKIKSTQNTCAVIKSGLKKDKFKSKPVYDDSVNIIISKTFLKHTGLCEPSSQQLLLQRSRSGVYINSLSTESIHILCSIYNLRGNLSPGIIKAMVEAQFSNNKNIKKQQVYAIRRRIKNLLPKIKDLEDYNDFKSLIQSSKLEIGIDNIDITNDDIAQIGKEIWFDIMNNNTSEETFCTFSQYMTILSQQQSGFEFDILVDSDNYATGCIWQTAVMRKNFELYGGYICLDAMKRPINKYQWPYMAIAMYNEMNKICVACEAIICTEREDAYRAMIDFVLRNTTL